MLLGIDCLRFREDRRGDAGVAEAADDAFLLFVLAVDFLVDALVFLLRVDELLELLSPSLLFLSAAKVTCNSSER